MSIYKNQIFWCKSRSVFRCHKTWIYGDNVLDTRMSDNYLGFNLTTMAINNVSLHALVNQPKKVVASLKCYILNISSGSIMPTLCYCTEICEIR